MASNMNMKTEANDAVANPPSASDSLLNGGHGNQNIETSTDGSSRAAENVASANSGIFFKFSFTEKHFVKFVIFFRYIPSQQKSLLHSSSFSFCSHKRIQRNKGLKYGAQNCVYDIYISRKSFYRYITVYCIFQVTTQSEMQVPPNFAQHKILMEEVVPSTSSYIDSMSCRITNREY